MHVSLFNIDGNAAFRGKTVDGVLVFSVFDFVNYVCGKTRTNSYARVTWQRLIHPRSLHRDELLRITRYVRYDGRGQQATPAMTMCGLQVLLQIMEGKVADRFRQAMRSVFNRYMAGDTSMISEVEANAASDAPIHSAYRQVLAGDIPMSDCPEAKRRKLAAESDLGGVHSFVRMQHQRALGRLINDDSHLFLGCSEADFKAHIQHKMDVYNQAHPGEPLTWATIHLDHIKPIASVPAGHFDPDVLHYTNIQPLSAQDNLRKGARWSLADEAFWRQHIFRNHAWDQVYLPCEA